MTEDWSGGSTRQWRKTRAYVLRRDAGVCQLRIADVCTYKATSAHHLLGKRHGDDPKFLVAACMPCNQHIGDPSGNDPTHTPHTDWTRTEERGQQRTSDKEMPSPLPDI